MYNKSVIKGIEVQILVTSDYNSGSMFQYTVSGVNTETGVIAVLNVVEELRLALGPALTLLQNMVVKTVRERLRIHRLVMNNLVQVRKRFFCESIYFFALLFVFF